LNKPAQTSQSVKYRGLLLDFNKGTQLILDVTPIELVLMPDDYPFGVPDIQGTGDLKKTDHRRSFANHSCISTNPEDGRAGIAHIA
jgi:hypothetical protein